MIEVVFEAVFEVFEVVFEEEDEEEEDDDDEDEEEVAVVVVTENTGDAALITPTGTS